MKTRTWILVGTLLVLPVMGLADDVPAAKPTPSVDGSISQSAARKPAPLALDLKDESVQKVVRASAAAITGPQQPLESAPLTMRPALQDIPFRAPRRPHHMDCDSFDCVAYTADDEALYSIPRDQYFGVNSDDPEKAWLSCQSGNDLLSTFERYDKCRGVSIGLPLQGHDVIVDLPKLRL
jgi:hypothetical protein